MMEFRILGPVEVRVEDRPIDTGHARQRSVLAVLLLELGRAASADMLIDRVWGEEQPASVRNVLYSYVARLRALLAKAENQGATIARHRGGYLLQARPDQLDLHRFHCLVAQAAATAGDNERAALLAEALGLWHGPALAGLTSPWMDGMRETLEQERTAAILDLNDIALRQGRHESLVSELTRQATAYPADERLTGQLMLALYRSGRKAASLRWFEQVRKQLADELGADPGPELQALHQRILRGDPSLAVPSPAGSSLATPGTVPVAAGSTAQPVIPRELPPGVPHFTGRSDELAMLTALLDRSAEQAPGAILISAIGGAAGVGKTALAVHWAHKVADRFPDGQLYINLHGYDPGPPVAAADALARFLRALGVSGQDIAPEEDERAARYRSLLAGRRMLVILDNAESAAQVRPLLPGSPTSTVLITSRDALTGLVARDGAHRLDLDLLPLADALRLLRELIGERADTSPDAAATLAGQCCRLPLALRIAAELAAARLDASLADLAGELADQQRRLDLLDAGGDPSTAVRAVFSWSYRHLEPDAARLFRLLALHPGSDFDRYAAAALAGATLERASHLLDMLAQAHLIEPAGQDRYGMHDLLRAYARELAAARDGAQPRREALSRLFDYYLYAAATAMDVIFAAESGRRPRIPPPATPCPAVTSIAAARAWLDTERATLVAVAAHAAAGGWPSHATRLAATLFRYLETGGHYGETIAIQNHARRAARETGDGAAEAEALHGLTVIDMRQGRYQQAADRLQQILALYRETGNQAGQARALGNLGIAGFLQGRYQQATSHFQQSLVICRETGNQVGEARHLSNLSLVELRLGTYRQACQHLDQALTLCREIGNRSTEAYALSNLGVVELRLGSHQQASEHLNQALAACRDSGNRDCEAYALSNLGVVKSRLGSHQQASEHVDQALAICRETGDRSSEAEALNSLGEILLAAGRPGDAGTHYAKALDLASQIDDKYEQARAHEGLARSHQASANLGQARQHWQQALTLYTGLGTPQADQVRTQLTAAGGDDGRVL
jgi:DNA-binding SARP family transcriptional activator/tetratricopeptide (TPR) repeat protein